MEITVKTYNIFLKLNYNSFSDLFYQCLVRYFKKQYDPKTGYKAIPLALLQPKISNAVF
jgi:hypothetical protein